MFIREHSPECLVALFPCRIMIAPPSLKPELI
jgi:hypothetical protein